MRHEAIPKHRKLTGCPTSGGLINRLMEWGKQQVRGGVPAGRTDEQRERKTHRDTMVERKATKPRRHEGKQTTSTKRERAAQGVYKAYERSTPAAERPRPNVVPSTLLELDSTNPGWLGAKEPARNPEAKKAREAGTKRRGKQPSYGRTRQKRRRRVDEAKAAPRENEKDEKKKTLRES